MSDPTAFTAAGSGEFVASAVSVREASTSSGEPGVTLNLVNVGIDQAAKTVLGDLLGLNFVVDDRVQGGITLQTTSPISKAALIDVFETVLRSRGGAIVEDAGFYRILPLEDARVREPSTGDRVRRGGPGLAVQVLSTNYVSAEEMRGILEPIAPTGGILRIDAPRNLIVVAGTASELAAMRETVALFDVDWMKGMSFALHSLKSSDPEAVSAELDTIFDTKGGPLKQMVRFVPNKRLNAVLVITSRPHYLPEAASWIARLDRVAESRDDSLGVYEVHNRKASELAPLLLSVFSHKRGAEDTAPGTVAPGLEPVEVSSQSADLIAAASAPDAVHSPTNAIASSGGPSIVADDTENSLVIHATSADHEKIQALLGRLDRLPTQVLLEATIAEVSLGDQLEFGVRWFFESGNSSLSLSEALDRSVGATLPGFSYLFSTDDVQVVLNALSGVTDVKIVSSPTLMVLDNKEAMLQVGDQVPIVTQTAQSTNDVDAPIVNSIELKDTGVILIVRPHVNESGRVVLDIQQEVSSVVPTTTSGIDSPTIRQRKIATTVVVADGEGLVLGGLIQDRTSQSRSKVPVLGDIPLLGNAFRHKRDQLERTELIVFIRPSIVHDVEEARMITDEYRSQLILRAPDDRSSTETIRRDAGRLFN